MSLAPEVGLNELRIELDRIDREMQALLIARSQVTDRVEEVKRRAGTAGSAFRPGREAQIMRMLAERHHGSYPFDSTENIWRVIIGTSTYVQVPYTVHGDCSGGDAATRDSVRFHFGFTVPYLTHHGARGVIEAVARSSGDLGMVRVDAGTEAGAWWSALADPAAPKIIARLPFVERPDHPAGLPVFLVAQPLAEAAARDLVLWSLSLDRWSGGLPAALGALGGEIIGNASDGVGLSLLASMPGTVDAAALSVALAEACAGEARIAEVGSHAARYSLAAQRHPGAPA